MLHLAELSQPSGIRSRLVQHLFVAGLFALLTIVASRNILLSPYFVDGFDFVYHFNRVVALETEIAAGNILPRWLPEANNGFGSPVFSFIWGVPYYLAVSLRQFGLSYRDCFKLLLIGSQYLALVGMYRFVTYKFRAGLVMAVSAALMYVWSPYFFVSVFKIMGLGTVVFWALLPWVMEAILVRRNSLVSALGIGSLLYSHHGQALVILPVLFVYGILGALERQKTAGQAIRTLVNSFGLGALLTAFFWLPAMGFGHYIHAATMARDGLRFPPPLALLRSPWEGGSFSGHHLLMSFDLGPAHIALALLALLVFGLRKKLGKLTLIHIFWLSLAGISVFMMTPLSQPLWLHLPLLINLQQPERFGLLWSLSVAMLVGLLSTSPAKKIIGMVPLIVLVNLFYHRNHFGVLENHASLRSLTWASSSMDAFGETQPINLIHDGLREDAHTYSHKWGYKVIEGNPTITALVTEPYLTRINLTASEPVKLKLQRAAFPGWQLLVNQTPVPIVADNGVIVTLPTGSFEIEYRYQDPLLIRLANGISLATAVAMILFAAKRLVLNIKNANSKSLYAG